MPLLSPRPAAAASVAGLWLALLALCPPCTAGLEPGSAAAELGSAAEAAQGLLTQGADSRGYARGDVPPIHALTISDAATRHESPRHGVEIEYSWKGEIPPRGASILEDEAAYRRPLEMVKASYGGKGSAIAMAPFDKFPPPADRRALYADPEGRLWQVVPEIVDSGDEADGFELVTPPIRPATPDEVRFLGVIGDIAATGLYGEGESSSSHFTLDADHLIGPDGEASRLVNAILFIESHWPEIYAVVAPRRYGTIVNHFSVPLAADQTRLLEELAALSKRERTIENVKAVFGRYHDREIALKRGRAEDAWKFRAANYGKLVGLRRPHLPVIEFRIADFPKGRDLIEIPALFRRLLTSPAALMDRTDFRSPFPSARSGEDFAALNAAVLGVAPEKVARFLDRLQPAPH